MAVIIKSNNAYTGTKALPNIIDSITTIDNKVDFLKKLLVVSGGDSAYITASNADAIFAALKNHRARVVADGGVVLSLANTLKALVFANQNSLSTNDYSAYAADFGIKLSGSTIVKVYDLASRDLKVLGGGFERATDNNFNVIKNLALGTLIATSSINGNQGLILGSSLHDASTSGGTSNAVKGVYLSDNAGGSGAGLGSLETDNGGTSRLYYKRASDGVINNLPYDQTTNYKKYSGLVGYMSNSNNRVELYESGALKAAATIAQTDVSAMQIYPTISMSAVNSLVRESWLIRSTSQTLAVALSNYLNKSV